MRDGANCGHRWEWHGPGKDCMCGCMWFDWPNMPAPTTANEPEL
jgi:hypothetical protein